MSKLYIIGNGFDLYHGIPSGYWNFKEYLERIDPMIFNRLDRYFDEDELWSDFETTLANLNTDELLEDASTYLMSYSDENWSESGHHDYQYEIEQVIRAVTSDLRKHFTNWILQLNSRLERYRASVAAT
jgi:hypothetical protein